MGKREKELWSCLALKGTPRLGPRRIKTLLAKHGSFSKVWKAISAGHLPLEKTIANNRTIPKKNLHQAFQNIVQNRQPYILLTDPGYPPLLKEIPDPPPILYYHGDPRLLQQPMLAVVGSRKASQYGLSQARRLSQALSQTGLTIVSGLARGIDAQAHWASLRAQGKSIAVLGTGLGICYPRQNNKLYQAITQEGGLLVSEFEPGTQPMPRNFPIRNRIISGLSLGVLVIEATEKSGSLITARLALEQGREIFALPGPIDKPNYLGCNRLIQQGALLVSSIHDILEALRPVAPQISSLTLGPDPNPDQQDLPTTHKTPIKGLTPQEETLLDLLCTKGKMHINIITQTLSWPSSQVSQLLTMLEVKGVVKQHPGLYYSCQEGIDIAKSSLS